MPTPPYSVLAAATGGSAPASPLLVLAAAADVAADVAATGTITFSGLPVSAAGQTITIGGYFYEIAPYGLIAPRDISAPFSENATNWAAATAARINAWTDGGADPNVTATSSGGVVTLTARITGTGGNAITLTEEATNVTVSGATLTGGSGGAGVAAPLAALAAAAGGGAPAAPLSVLGAVQNSGAYLETNFTGTHNDLRFNEVGASRDPLTSIQFTMDNSGIDSVSVTGNAILVHLRRNLGAYYMLASDIKALLESSAAAMALVSVAYKAGNDGSGKICQPSPFTNDISFGPSSLATEV